MWNRWRHWWSIGFETAIFSRKRSLHTLTTLSLCLCADFPSFLLLFLFNLKQSRTKLTILYLYPVPDGQNPWPIENRPTSPIQSQFNFTSCPPFWMQCFKTISWWLGSMLQILAVESPEPEAKRSSRGFQAQMKTSESWPFRTQALNDSMNKIKLLIV